MAVSKKPRKQHRKKFNPAALMIKRQSIEDLKSVFTRFELACAIKLPRGTCDLSDMLAIKDILNVATISMTTRKWLDVNEINEISDEFTAAKYAIADVIKRGRDSGKYICKGDELKLIQPMVSIAGQIIQDSLDVCPRRMIKEWNCMRQMISDVPGGCKHFDPDILERTLNAESYN